LRIYRKDGGEEEKRRAGERETNAIVSSHRSSLCHLTLVALPPRLFVSWSPCLLVSSSPVLRLSRSPPLLPRRRPASRIVSSRGTHGTDSSQHARSAPGHGGETVAGVDRREPSGVPGVVGHRRGPAADLQVRELPRVDVLRQPRRGPRRDRPAPPRHPRAL